MISKDNEIEYTLMDSKNETDFVFYVRGNDIGFYYYDSGSPTWCLDDIENIKTFLRDSLKILEKI